MMVKMRIPDEEDRPGILDVHREAFGAGEGEVIVNLVRAMLDDPTAQPLWSLAAEEDGKWVGHVLFTHVTIQGAEDVSAQILAPLAVIPAVQRKGVGRQLIEEGLRQLEADGVELVFVLGHPGYYRKCGFTPAGVHGFDAPHPIDPKNADAWMVQSLQGNALDRHAGTVQCCEAIMPQQYWEE